MFSHDKTRQRRWLVLWGSVGLLWSGWSHPPIQASPQPLSSEQITERLVNLPSWHLEGQQLRCTYRFENFVEAIAFVNRLVAPAETLGHHPDLSIAYNQVTVVLTTHDAGGLTALDFALAEQIARQSGPSPTNPRQCVALQP